MDWAQKYRSMKDKSKDEGQRILSPDEHFDLYKTQLQSLYKQFHDIISTTMIQEKYPKIHIPKTPRDSFMSEKEKVDSMILSDNDSELKLIPEGIHFIGVLGRVAVKAFKKVYTFNSVVEKKIQLLKEPYFFLIHDIADDNGYTWGSIQDDNNIFSGNEIKKLRYSYIESLLDEVFLSG